MKFLSLILVFVIAFFTAKPLLSNLIHHEIIEKEVVHECCGHCSGACCGDKNEGACDTSTHDCSQDCTCVMDGIVVFTQAPSPQIELFETISVQIETRYIEYQFSLPVTIWHPPQNESMC